MTEIQITRTADEPGATTLSVEAPVDVVQAAEDRAASTIAKKVRLPGFRKGKAPAAVIRRRFGDAIREQVIRDLISDSWKRAIEQEALEPIAEPQVRELTFNANEPVRFQFLVETKPELSVDRLSGFTVERTVQPVVDGMVEEQLEELRKQKAPWQPVEDRKPGIGDMVHVSTATLTDDGPEEARPYQIVLGDGQALPAVEEKIMELLPGESADTTITFPDDFGDEAKRGQSVRVRLSVHEVKRKDLAELDDDFAREVGDFETLDQLRKVIREDMEAAARREADAEVRRALLEQVVAANNIPAPRPMVERMLRAYAEGYGIPAENLEKFATEFGPVVEAQVRRELLIDTVARTQDLAATEDDLDDRIDEIAQRQKTEPGKVYAALQKENRLKELERSLTEEKVFAYLIEHSTIQDS